MDHLITITRDVLLPYGALGVFWASIIEEVIAPIPSALVLTAAGFFLVPHGTLSESLRALFIIVAIPGALGITIGSLFIYGIAYISGKLALLKWGRYLGISWEDIENFEKRFEKGYMDELALFTVRALPILPSVVITAFCGLVRLPVKEYVIFSFLGLIVRAFTIGFIGWQVGNVYEKFAEKINTIENTLLILTVALVLLFIAYRIYRRQRKQSQK